uniref:Cytochrome p450 n=1 Tax=Moniliophthora roreri TaxID=221103 RepID=A0A0W0G5V0_MONRR
MPYMTKKRRIPQCFAAEEPVKRMNDDEVLAQTSIFNQSAHHASGSFIFWIFYELARNPAYGYEADDTSSDYDDIPYLNAVLQETPRFHPIVTTIFRQATHDDYPALYPGYIAVQRRDDHSHCCRERSAHLVPIIATICTHLFMGQHGS